MTDSDAELSALKRRFRRMVGLLVLAVALGGVGLACYFMGRQPAGMVVFVAALVGGFAAQVWFLAGFRSTSHR